MDQETLNQVKQWLFDDGINLGLNILGAITILVVGTWIARIIKSAIAKMLLKLNLEDPIIVGFLSGFAYYAVMAAIIVVVLSQFGVETTSIIALLGAAGLAVGLALQGTLSNVAAGVMLLLLRPFKANDFVEVGGHGGTVVAVGLFTTELKTTEGVFKIVPNNQIINAAITNFTRNDTRRIDVIASIHYDDNLEAAMPLMRKLMQEDDRFLRDPEPLVFLDAMASSSINLQVRGWVKTEDYWKALWDLRKAIKLTLEENGFTIPYPQQDVYLHQINKSGAEKETR